MQPFEIKHRAGGGTGHGNGVRERVVRVLRIVSMLQRNSCTVDELAECFAISRRTVYRDLKLIELADLPLVSEHAGKGYRLLSRSLGSAAADPPARPTPQR